MSWNHVRAMRWCAMLVIVWLLAPISALAQVVAPSLFTTGIQVQGEAAGTEFDDWAAAAVPIADMDPVDNPGTDEVGLPFVDLADVQIANDSDYIYIRATTHGAHTSFAQLFVAFDTDQNVATGFDPFALGVIGSEFSYQTDFPFAQDTGVFNTGEPVSGGIFGNGGALIFPFWTEEGAPQGTQIEWQVPRDAAVSGAPVFSSDSFDFVIWTESGLGDITQRISYTFAEAPPGEPGDYNGDGSVDAADYVVWRKNAGTMNLLPNDPHGGVIGTDQYDTWREHFGMLGGQGSGAIAAPEPSAVVLLILAGCASCLPKRRALL